jgi:hypothetical protein
MTKYRGYRAIFQRNTTGSTYVTIANVLEIGEVGSTRALVDVTAHGDEWMDFLGARQEGTEFEIRTAYDPNDAQHTALKTDYDAGTSKKYHMIHPDITGSTAGVELTAIITGWRVNPPQDGAYTATAQLKIVNPGVALIAQP